ncbi:MAG TPA: PEP-CTERM sorting domain-containing protein, partial [Steroidobacteraceae bacterium]|nr:PEP-CTERM sorting domain-containing protein [Steroidobacteraceae bacterium]
QFENSGQSPYLVLGGGVDESRYFSSTPGSLLSISIGSDTWEAAGLSISARNDSTTFNQDMLQFAYTTNFSLIDNALPPPTSFPGVSPGLLNSSFGFSLFDDSQNMLSSQDLPGSAADINLVSTSLRNGSIFGNADGQNAFWNINFDVNSISLRDVPTEVPEPDTLSLMAAGLLAAGLLVRRRRPQAGLGTG